ncbi:hypothetical protein Hanom_Chr08g00755471 [Helianthus anomalus]
MSQICYLILLNGLIFMFCKAPRKDCCRVLPSRKEGVMYLWVGHCGENEVIEV